jgi:hypothetical protein
MQISAPSAFGNLTKGGPLASYNYNWVMSSNRLFQFVGSFMFNKPNDYEPIDGLTATKVIQSNPTGNILGSLTTIAQEGGFGATDTSHRSMTYLSPSMTFMANRLGSHEFRGGADLYPNIENDTSSNLAPVEYYFRPPGTTGSQDVLFERDTLRNLDGSGATIANKAYEHHYAMLRIAGSRRRRWRSRPASASRRTRSTPPIARKCSDRCSRRGHRRTSPISNSTSG